MEKSYVMVKPEFANNDRIVSLVRKRIADMGYKIEEESFVKYNIEDAQSHYAEHFNGSYEKAKPFYKALEEYITSDVAYGMVISGKNVKEAMREMIKDLRVKIPALLGQEPDGRKNVLHGSDLTPNSEVNEIRIFHKLAKEYENSQDNGNDIE